MDTVLVTGGAGFIGSHIVDELIKQGYNTIIVDNLSSGNNINDKAKFYKVDLRDYDSLKNVFDENRINYVIHTAAQISVSRSVREPLLDEDINIKGMLNLLELASKNNVKKVVFSSSGGVMYGDTDIFPSPETICPNPISPYGIAKLAGEKYLAFYKREKGLDFTALRYGNVYGPRQNPDGEAGVIAIFSKKMLNNQPVIINGDGRYVRDYVYVKDVMKANILALTKASGEIINIGTEIGKDVNDVFDILKIETGYKGEKKYGPARPGDLRKSLLDNSKAKKLLNWEPSYTFEQGIKETVEYFKRHH